MNVLGPFLSGAFQNGFKSGYVKARMDAYIEERGERPPASVLAQWNEQAARKALGR
jgi:hypothetical protein